MFETDARGAAPTPVRPCAEPSIFRRGVLLLIALLGILTIPLGAYAVPSLPLHDAPIDSSTWVDHDAQPIDKPGERSENFYSHCVRTAVVDPVGHFFDVPDKVLWLAAHVGLYSKQRAANVNAFDEVANSTWFTNRNHVRAVALDSIRAGAYGEIRPAPPFTITGRKEGGTTFGFRVADANGKKWLFKLDPPGCPQLVSGADVVVSRLAYAAGYNISHDEAVSFRYADLKISDKLQAGTKNDAPFSNAELEAVLAQGAHGANDRYYAEASLFEPGENVGTIDTRGRRPDDPNDRFDPTQRRELRGLFVFDSWVGGWDEYDMQSLEMFQKTEGKRGYVEHSLLDFGSTLGASSVGAKPLPYGYEYAVDYGWFGLRAVTGGVIEEPWRRAHQRTGLPSAGNFDWARYDPPSFRTYLPYRPFRARTLDDDYWGAKLVAAFSDAQIAAAIQAAGYEDSLTSAFLQKALTARRDEVARYYFARVAPLDFFSVSDSLKFRDLAVDLRLVAPRAYEVRVVALAGTVATKGLRLAGTALALDEIGPQAETVRLTISIPSEPSAKPATVDLARRHGVWTVTRVRHAIG